MARPLRIERAGGRYHITARGNERKAVFRDDTDRYHFLELLAELSERFGSRVHAYVLMDNHFHLLLETPEPNLSRSMHWLEVSYSVWFNRRHRRAGHLYQGRFKALVIQDEAGWQEVARYVHLNPVRVAALDLGKRQRAASRAGLLSRPEPATVGRRLRLLRKYRWSSYRGYAGYGAPLAWVWQEPLSRLCGGQNQRERQAALRAYTEQPLRQGSLERPWDRLVAGLVLGTQAFARSLRRELSGNLREQSQIKGLIRPVAWSQIVLALEQVKGESWAVLRERYGDWGRDAALWLGRRQGRLSLAQLGRLAGEMDYAAVSQALRRFGQRLQRDAGLRRQLEELKIQLSES